MLEVRDLRKSYGGVVASDGVQLHVREGELVGELHVDGQRRPGDERFDRRRQPGTAAADDDDVGNKFGCTGAAGLRIN